MKNMTPISFLLFLGMLATPLLNARENQANSQLLKGLNYLHMHVQVESERDIDRDMRNQMADVVELELLRAQIPLEPYVVNEPESNIPLLLVTLAVDRNGPRPVTRINLQVIDTVVVARNKATTTATIYSRRADAASGSDTSLARDTRDSLRDLMKQFVTDYRSANPR